jgi:hypothetical protein
MISVALLLLPDTVMAKAASPAVETALATTSPMVAKQNGHIVHLSGWRSLIDH